MKFAQLAVSFLCIHLASFFSTAGSDDVSTTPDGNDWSSYNYDVTGTRHNRVEKTLSSKNVANLIQRWRFPADDYPETVGVIHATPTVVNGYVYFGTATYPTFYKLAPNGDLKWRYHVRKHSTRKTKNAPNQLVPADGVYISALVTGKGVYFADGAGVIYALDRNSGKELWKVDSRAKEFPGSHPANLFLSSPIMADGKVIIGGGAYEHVQPTIPFYKCCRGRGCVVALDPLTGNIVWKYDVGPEPEEFDPPLTFELYGVKRKFHYGPSTSSVWCTPSFDVATKTIFFGTDVHNAPRKPTDDDPRNYTRHSAAIIALHVQDGTEKWITQITKGDIWNHTLPTYDPKTGYKDQSIGDTPKIYSIEFQGRSTDVVGFGSKNGGFYVLQRETGELLFQTPIYTGPQVVTAKCGPRMLALPSAIGGLQTGCATDGIRVFTNGIDAIKHFPTGGRVTSISLDTRQENWRHERPRVAKVTRPSGRTPFENVGDPVASGIAVANKVVYFTTLVSNQLVALDSSNGELLKQIPLGPVFAGPAISRGRVYIGTGNTLWSASRAEEFYPKRYTGTLHSFGLPGQDEVARMEAGSE